MSEGDVELVRAFQPAPDEDLVQQFTSDAWWTATIRAVGQLFDPELVCEIVWPGGRVRYVGLDGLRAGWLDWLSVWHSYHVEIDDVVDLGDRVLVLTRDRGRSAETSAELYVLGAAIWTVRDGKVARIEFFPDRRDAMETAGLAGGVKREPGHPR